MNATRALLLFVVPVLCTCASSSSRPDPAPGPAPAPKAALGAACEVAPSALAPGGCAEGLVCASAPGGVCTSSCGGGQACAEGASCAEGPALGALCLKSCMSDVDCRADEGWACDEAWAVCAPRGSLAPKMGSCAAPAPEKKRFGPAKALTDEGDSPYQSEPAAAVLQSGDVAALYLARSGFGQGSRLAAAVVPKGQDAPVDGALKSERESAADPSIAVDAAGALHAAWLEHDGTTAPGRNARVAYAASTDGKAWSAPVIVHEEAGCPAEAASCIDRPVVAVGPSKENPKQQAIYVAYWSGASDGLHVRRSLDGGKTFEAPVPAGPAGTGDLEVAPDGTIHVVGLVATSAEANKLGDPAILVEHRTSSDGGKSFSEPVRVSREGEPVPYFFSSPQVAVDAKRKLLYVAYASGTPDGRWDIQLATSKDGGRKWSHAKVNDDVTCANHMTPALAVDPKSGKVHVLWIENRTDEGGAAYAQCKSGGKSCSTNEAVHDEPFAAYSFALGTAKGLGEHPSLALDAKNKKIHALWTAPVEKDGAPAARVFHAVGKLD